ncbi:MAG: hypothetical protein EP335_10660 [Alphaproteobacteria bacterium]|nr:MAG: hypothetical protein EP335_10660 [Alphaproteobacteria bacterium]
MAENSPSGTLVRRTIGLAAGALALAGPVAADDGLPTLDIDIYADVRAVAVADEWSWFENWLGKGRYGGGRGGVSNDRLTLSEVSILAKAELTWDLKAFVHAKYDPEQDKPLDLVEAYLSYNPVPTSSLSFDYRAGLLFPHISRENTGVAWTSPYTITPSAINSWIGEEIRALAVEAKATWKSGASKTSLTAAIFGFNDPAGTLLAFRGWAFGDYKVGAFSQLPLPFLPSIGPDSDFLNKQPLWVHPVFEVDNKPGFYGALDWSYGRRVKAGLFYYDNRGNPEALEHKQYAWDTRFWNGYVELAPAQGLTVIGQAMTGNTKMGALKDGINRAVDVDYRAVFVLASYKFGTQRLSARRDWYETVDNSFVAEDNNNENGTAWTLAYSIDVRKKDRIMVEFLHLDSFRPSRREQSWTAPQQSQSILQLSYRLHF